MAFQNRNFRDRGNRSFNKPSHGEMFDAVCAKCSNACKVPFQPNGKKDVLCSNCFKSSRDESIDFRGPRHFDNHRPSFNGPANNQNMDIINAKLDKILALLSE